MGWKFTYALLGPLRKNYLVKFIIVDLNIAAKGSLHSRKIREDV